MMVRIWRLNGHLNLLFASILVGGLMVGCAGPGGVDTSSDNGSPAATDTNSADHTNPTKNARPTDNTDSTDDGLAWVPFGPSDPTSPTPSWPAYNFFADGKCSELRDYLSGEGSGIGQSDLGKAMVAVCGAAVEGQSDQWVVAEAHAGADPAAIQESCLGALVKDLLDRALAWHQQHPGRTPTVQMQRVEGRTECGKHYPSDNVEPPSTSESSATSESPPTSAPSTETTG